MRQAVAIKLAQLQTMSIPDLRCEYRAAFGEATRSNNKAFLVRRLAWRYQAAAEGGLTERALKRADDIGDLRDIRIQAPRSFDSSTTVVRTRINQSHDLPPVGSYITRKYKGTLLAVQVLSRGFEWGGTTYRSLSAVAHAITGSKWNGRLFFGLTSQETSDE